MLIHSLFPSLIHMLFGHNTSMLYDSPIKPAAFAFTSLEAIHQYYKTFMYMVATSAFLKVNREETHKLTTAVCGDEIRT